MFSKHLAKHGELDLPEKSMLNLSIHTEHLTGWQTNTVVFDKHYVVFPYNARHALMKVLFATSLVIIQQFLTQVK